MLTLIITKGFIIHDITNMVAEVRAIRESLSYYIEHEIANIVIETDFLDMAHILKGEWEVWHSKLVSLGD